MVQGIYTSQPLIVAAGDALDVSISPYCVSFDTVLPSTVNLDAAVTPTASVSPSGITLSGLAVNASEYTDNDGSTCAAGRGVVFVKTGGSRRQDYTATITAGLVGGGTIDVLVVIEVR